MVHGYLFDDETPPLKRALLLTAERVMAPKTYLLLTMNRWDFEAAKRYWLGKKVIHIPGIGVDFARLDCQGEQERGNTCGRSGAFPAPPLFCFMRRNFPSGRARRC